MNQLGDWIKNWTVEILQNVFCDRLFFTFFFHHTCLPPACIQRKSNRAKEKKARRLEERAAMDAVCAKVDAANKVTCRAVIHACVASSWFDWIDYPQVESKLVLKCDDPQHSGFWLAWYSVRVIIASDSPLALETLSGDIWTGNSRTLSLGFGLKHEWTFSKLQL